MSSIQEPLLPERPQPRSGLRKYFKICCFTSLFLLLLCFSFIFGYLYTHDAFDEVKRNFHMNETHVTDPNTGVAFPLQLTKVDPYEKQTIYRIVGFYLSTEPFLGANIRVSVTGLYVDRRAGRLLLKNYQKSGAPKIKESKEEFEKFFDMFTSMEMNQAGLGILSLSHMLLSVPSLLVEMNLGRLKKHLKEVDGMTDERLDHLMDLARKGSSKAISNGVLMGNLWIGKTGKFLYSLGDKIYTDCDDPAYGYATVKMELEIGEDLNFNLLKTLWDRSIDKEFNK